jgi:transglutaminase-like putative cysteine protease
MHYAIRHLTKFRYSTPISESFMELRMQPRTEATQHCVWFDLSIKPRTRLTSYRDRLGNLVHHFDVPGHHTQLAIKSEAVVDIAPQTWPESLGASAWQDLDAMVGNGDYWEMLMPSRFASPTDLLGKLARELDVSRRDDPLMLLRQLTAGLRETFEYAPQATEVDSPIDEALRSRRGVCQDFAHIMIALVRGVGIPCRYVSGYLFHRDDEDDRSAEDATHAWVEALLPGLGWVGFDPTNNLIASERHIRVAIGRDYGDVPPTRGIFKGQAKTDLSVAVKVIPSAAPPPQENQGADEVWLPSDSNTDELSDFEQVRQKRKEQQQQQQQQ